MARSLTCLCCVLLSIPAVVRADETIRQVQEELRKRNLYFGNIDGRTSPVVTDALKRYQTRKGFPVTGKLDEDTATSLHIQTATVGATASLPDVPVLKSDTARALPESQRLALQNEVEEKPDMTPSPPPPAESPAPGQDLTPERVNKLVQDYLRDGETESVAAQLKYYAFPVRYFDHGTVSEQFVTKDTTNYVKRWPERKYTLTGPVNFFASGNDGETEVEFSIAFDLRSAARTSKNRAFGHTKNWWTVQAKGDELKIVAIREARLRE
ncbi:MAG TPA: peptidoglycan-binding domain-containing protein [Chthoniobacterales bacterium]|nr:peptidoglycan-binding domain-containing protein [Chthoniobacterales bacterium]